MTSPPDVIALSAARSLCRTLRLLRTETAARVVDGTLSLSAGDLLGVATDVTTWIEDLVAATVTADADQITLPAREPWELRHIAYTISAVLVWAESMRAEGLLTTSIPPDALTAWARVEALAGMAGRTTRTLDLASVADADHGSAGDPDHDAAPVRAAVRLRDLAPATR